MSSKRTTEHEPGKPLFSCQVRVLTGRNVPVEVVAMHFRFSHQTRILELHIVPQCRGTQSRCFPSAAHESLRWAMSCSEGPGQAAWSDCSQPSLADPCLSVRTEGDRAPAGPDQMDPGHTADSRLGGLRAPTRHRPPRRARLPKVDCGSLRRTAWDRPRDTDRMDIRSYRAVVNVRPPCCCGLRIDLQRVQAWSQLDCTAPTQPMLRLCVHLDAREKA